MLLSALLLFSLIFCPVNSSEKNIDAASGNWSSYYASSFGGGDGSEKNPYKISTAPQLARLIYVTNIANLNKGCYFEITENIDLSAHYWTPLGNNGTDQAFSGVINGNNHVISGLNIISGNNNNAAFVGFGNNIKIFNLVFGNPTVTSSDSFLVSMAVVLGSGTECEISDIKIYSGSISFFNSAIGVGGVLGGGSNSNLEGIHVRYCFVYDLNINAPSGMSVGGIVATAGINIDQCYFSGTVIGFMYVGGIVAFLNEGKNLTNCISNISELTATDTSSNRARGFIVGSNNGTSSFCISNAPYIMQCYGENKGRFTKLIPNLQKLTSIPSEFDTNIWGINSYISNGYVYLKYAYWQNFA